ncbi:MAG: 3-oxoacyl-ACP reductase FabG [Verrucomicrobia bacterium]|nr:3-oxoacyl-ACP reductase FabG [Verrucomicrobiota bacterium]
MFHSEILKGKVAIVTGGTAGIGRAIAERLALAGANVVIFGRNPERGHEIVAKLTGQGQLTSFIGVDVASTTAVEEAIKQVLESHGKVDILVNNAGITKDGLLMRLPEEDWDEVMAVNLKSAYNTSRAVVRPMMKQRNGKIVNISSVVGLTGNAGQAHYAASKAGLIGFSKSLARELASRGICVNCVAPGFIETAMTDVLNDAQRAAILETVPLKRMGQPHEIADAVLFLCSESANYITGQVLTVDGGMVM